MVRREIGGKGRTQARKRMDSVKTTVDNEINTLRKTVDKALEIAPVQAMTDLIFGSINNVGNFIKKQAEITRERVK